MRIARIVERLPPHIGGKETHVFELTRALADLGVVQVVYYRTGDPPMAASGVRLRSGMSRDHRLRLAAFCTAAARAICRHQRIAPLHAIHAHGDFPEAVAACIAARTLGIPAFLSIHGGLSRVRWHDGVRLVSFSAMQRIFAPSPAVAEEIASRGVSSEVIVRPSAVRSEFFKARGATRDPDHVVFVGRLTPVKGLETLMGAYDSLGDDAKAMRWSVLGDGTDAYADRMRAEIRSRPGMECRAEYDADKIARTVASASVLILASRAFSGQREGTPTAALEALAAGTPVIASDKSGLDRFVGAESCIRFFPAGDSGALAVAIRERARLDAPPTPPDGVDNWERAAADIADQYIAGIEEFRRTSVFFAVPWLEVGGAEHLVLSLADGSAQAGHRTCVAGAPGSLYSRIRPPLELVPLTWNSRLHAFGHNTLALTGALARTRPVAINSHHFLLGAAARLAAALAGLRPRHVLTVHVTELRRNEAVVGALGPLLFDSVLPVADVVRDDLVRFTPPFARNRLRVVHAGIDPPSLRDGRPQVIGVIARLVPRKGHRVLIEAWSQIATDPRVQGWTLEIVGDGPERTAIEDDVRRLGVHASVRIRGSVLNAADLLSEYQLLVLPSLREGLPLVLIEAMAARCPIVATSLPGCQELAGEHAALLVPPGNAHELAKAMLDLISDSDLRRALAERGHARFVAAFTRKRMLEGYQTELGVSLSGSST